MTIRRKNKLKALKVCTNICRLLLAAVFILSGFVKANDPLGTAYKLSDYAASVCSLHIPSLILLTLSIGISFVEFTMGIYLFFGISRKKMSRLVVIFMSLMTLITIYIYIFNPVSDCGCFGDAIILSNGQTLAKNIILLAAAIFLKRYSKLQTEFVPDRMKWVISMASMLFILAFAARCIIYLPEIDFRPYKIGTNLQANYESYSHSENFDVRIVYEKNGKTMELSIDDDDPDSTWTYVETVRNVKNKKELETSNFYFTDSETEEDVTEDLLYEEVSFLLIIPDLMHADESCVDRINDLYDYAKAEGFGFHCLTGSIDKKAQDYWSEHTGAEYGYSIGDERLLKTIVRGNPGLVILRDGVIKGKWSNYKLPTIEELSTYK